MTINRERTIFSTNKLPVRFSEITFVQLIFGGYELEFFQVNRMNVRQSIGIFEKKVLS